MRRKLYSTVLSVVLSVSMTATAFGGWSFNKGNWTYEMPDKTQARDCWYQEGEHWYHFDKDGIMQTGWFQDKDGRRYYLDEKEGGPKGAMRTGWFQDKDGKWYWFNTISDGYKGAMTSGWKWINGKCYYLQADGSCLMNGVSPDGYTVNENGEWTVNGVVQIRNTETASTIRKSGGGSGGGSGGSSGGGSHGQIVPPAPSYEDVYAGDTSKSFGWEQDSNTEIYSVKPGTYGNVFITASIGNGEVVLENVDIKGNLTVQGGGSNSIKLKGSTSVQGSVIMDKSPAAGSQAPRLELSDSVTIGRTEIKQKAVLESVSDTASFGNVDVKAETTIKGGATKADTVNVNADVPVNISDSAVKQVNMDAKGTLNGTGDASVAKIETTRDITIRNLQVKEVSVKEEAAITVSEDSAVELISADAPTSVKSSNGSMARIQNIVAGADVKVGDVMVGKIIAEQEVTITTTDSSAAIAEIEAKANLQLSSEDGPSSIGTVSVTGKDVSLNVGQDIVVNTVEAKESVTVDGAGSVGMIAAQSGTDVSGELGGTASAVTFLDGFSMDPVSVAYGTDLPKLETNYSVAGVQDASISWNPYTFTSRQPGTYTVYGSWVSLPDGYMAGGVVPFVTVTVEEPEISKLTFTETNGLTGLDVSLKGDGGQVFSYAGDTAKVLKTESNYSYTVSKPGYKPCTGTVSGKTSSVINVTLKKAEQKYQITFDGADNITTYLNGDMPDSKEYLEGARIVLPTSHTRPGYNLIWSKSGSQMVSTEIIVEETATYTASWEKISYTIAFEGGTLQDAKGAYDIESDDYKLPKPSDTDKGTFDGWYTNASFAGSRVETLDKGSTGHKVYYAKWLKKLQTVDNVQVTTDVGTGSKLDHVYFADGKNVIVSDYDNSNPGSQDKLLVTVGSTQYLADKDLNIYAGSYAKDGDASCKGGSITINSGAVANIFGGGAGTSASWIGHKAVTEGDVRIQVNGGSVGSIYGGGTGLAEVIDGTVKIRVNSTEKEWVIRHIFGGGSAPFGSINKNLDAETHHSANHVEHVLIDVAQGVKIHTLQGGGISISSVDKAEINLDGTVEARMIGGGTNGYTGDVSINLGENAVLEAGNAYTDENYRGNTIYQTGFRGIIGDAAITVKEGAQIQGDIFLGTNALYKDGQNAKITGTITAEFESNPMVAAEGETEGVIYLGAGEDGTSLNDAQSISISGPVAISNYLYSQRFNNHDETLIPEELKNKVTLSDGAYWDNGFAGGSGTEEDPYLISNAEELENIAAFSTDEDAQAAYYMLTDDIDVSGLSEEALKRAYIVKSFKGVLDGGGYSLLADKEHDIAFAYSTYGAEFRNLNIVQNSHYINLNYFVYDDIKFSGVDVENAADTTFVTNSQNESSYCSNILNTGVTVTFEDCHNQADYEIAPGSWGGVFVGGYGQTDTQYIFRDCSNSGTVYGKYAALFIGNSHQAADAAQITVENCTNDGYIYGTEFAGLFAVVSGKGYEAANKKYASLSDGEHIKKLSIEGITASAAKDGTITVSLENQGDSEFEYVLNVFSQYKYDGGTSLVAVDFPVEDTTSVTQRVGWILDSKTAEDEFGIVVNDLTWDKTMINMQPKHYAYYEAEVLAEEEGGQENEVTKDLGAFYIFDVNDLEEGTVIKSKGTFQINVYVSNQDSRILAGSVKVDASKVDYSSAAVVKKALLPEEEPANQIVETLPNSNAAGETDIDGQETVTKPDGTDAETGNTDIDKSETGDTDTGKSETGDTDTDKSETGNTDTGKSETGNTDTDKSETGDTDTGKSETGDTDTDKSETGNTDTDKSETGNTDTGKSETGNTDTGKSETGSTDTDKSETGNTDTGKSETGNTGSENQGTGADSTVTDNSVTE